MATLKQIQFKRSKTAGARPAASVLAEGELAINLKDRTIFTKDDTGNIIDLSISAGGSISGNITQTGDYLQNGTYNLNGNQFVYAGKYIEFLPKTAGNGAWANQHKNKAPIFTDLSSTTSTSEYHPLIKQRYKDGTFSVGTLVNEGSFKIHYIDETGDSKYWTFRRDGGFVVDTGSLTVTKGNISASGNINSATGIVSAPQINTKTIVFDTKAFGQYDSQSLVQYVYPGTGETNGVNYLRKVRAKSGGTIYHEICTAQTGLADEVSWWTGNIPLFKLYGIRNDGRMIIRNSLAIGTVTEGYPSSDYGNTGVMGDRYLALGDNASGLKWVRTGVIDLMANGISAATIINNGINSTKKLMVGYSRDSGSTWVFPNNNQAMFTARTDVDGNNNGDGQTHIGYSSNSKMYHYFRGTGRMSVSMGDGLLVEPGILDIKTGSNSLNLRADGTVASVQTLKLNNGLYFNGDGTNASLVFKAASGIDGTKQIMWEGGTRAGQNKSYVSIKAWGNSFNASGDRARETVFEVADGKGYYFYAQRTTPASGQTVGPVNFKFNGTVETGHIIGLGNISASGTGSFGGNVTMSNGLFVQGGSSITGQLKLGNTFDALRIWNSRYGAIFRRSETSLYIIPTNENEGENGAISSLRPFTIELGTGAVSMNHVVNIGQGKFKVDTSGTTASQRITVNAASDAIRINAPTQESSNFIQGRKADVTKWYLGIGDGGNVVRLHNYTYSHGIALNSDTVDITKPLKINNIRIGTDGNITGGSGNFANLNTTLNRKVNVGGWAGSSDGGWYKFATVTIPQGTGTVTFKISGGAGFNFKSYSQASIAEIVLRTGNNNPKGINAVLWNRSDLSFNQIATMNTSGDTYDVYVFCDGYTNALVVEYSCSENSSVTVVGLNGGIQPVVDALPEGHVVGKTVRLLNNIGGTFAAGESNIVTRGEYVTDNQKGMRIKSNGNNIGSNAALIRNDGGSFYILATDKNTTEKPDAANGDWNGLRPLSINMTDGRVAMNHGLNITGGGLNVTGGNTNLGNISSRLVSYARAASGWGDTSDAMKSKITFMADHGDLSNSGSYYPIVGAWSNYGSAGYRQTFEFGWVGSGTTAGWRDGIIRIRGDNANGQQARWRFTMDGTLDCPGKVLLPQTGAFGVNTSNGLGGNSITFGDSDTGIKQNGDGLLDIYANSVQVFRFQNGDLYSYKNINAPNVYIRSDIRLKSNFKPIENALDKVEKLNGVIYDKAEYIGGEAIETEAGIVAQTLQDVLPEAVRETEDSKGNKILTVSSQAQIALLVEAVKTLSSRVKELESKLM